MNLLDILLALMNKKQLWRDVLFARTAGAVSHLFIIWFDRKIPEGQLVVRGGCRKNGIFRWMPLNRCDWGSMPAEGCHRCRIWAGGSMGVW